MAYGKIKADSIIYDNSGSDVEKTIASLATPDEGTAIKSTGEGSTTKFLRTDGDGTCSWQVPTDTNTQLSTEQVQDIVGAMVTGNTETGIAVTYEDGDGTLDFVVGNAATATEATNVTAVANNSTDETVYPVFVDGATGTQGIETDTGLTYNPSTGLLSTAAVTTTGNVIVGGNLTVNGTTTTVNAATLEVEDKNIELGKVSSPSDTTADGGGITLKGASDKTFNWINSIDAWESNQHIHIGDNLKLDIGTGSDFQIYHDGTNSKIVNSTGTLYLQPKVGEEGINIVPDGGVNLYYDNAKKLETTNTGVYVGGSVHDDKGDVRKIIQNHKTSAYVLVASDSGKMVTITTGGITVNQSVFAAGDAVSIINHSGSDQTITQGSSFSLHNTADATTGNRTLAGRGMATIWFSAHNEAYISGAGLS